MDELKFSLLLKEVPVLLKGKNEVEKKFMLRELTGAQRATYNASFDVKIEVGADGKAKASAGGGFKMFSAKQFLALCLYDESDKLVSEEIIGGFPGTVVNGLHKAALKLSGLDKESLESAKND